MLKQLIFFCLTVLALTSCETKETSDIELKKNDQVSQIDNETIAEMQKEEKQVEKNEKESIVNREPITNKGFLKAVGKNIYNNKGMGDLVQLKGVNLGGYLFQEFWMTPTRPSEGIEAELDIYNYLSETYGEERMRELIKVYQDSYLSNEDFDNMSKHGINVIRLPFWYLNIVDYKGEFLENWYVRFDWIIEEAGKRGMYVILDFHGAPGSQNGSDHSGVDGGDHKEAASEFFYGDSKEVEDNQNLYYMIWEEVAKRYAGNPVVAGYDLLNEPYCTYRYDSSLSVDDLHQTLWNIYDVAYRKIRAIDPDHMIIMEATWDPVDLPDPKVYDWENIAYEYHNYMFDDYDNANGEQIQSMAKKLNLISAANYDLPSYMGEFSYFNSYEAWDKGIKLLTDKGLHWTVWTYRVTSDYGNWGMYHHNSGDISITAVDDKKLEIIWGKVGEARPNTRLIQVLEPYFWQTDVLFE